jgi:hypothetical protein
MALRLAMDSLMKGYKTTLYMFSTDIERGPLLLLEGQTTKAKWTMQTVLLAQHSYLFVMKKSKDAG